MSTKSTTGPALAHALLSPRSVALVGASDATKTAGRPLQFLRSAGFGGTIYPINPRATVQGEKAYPSLAALPEVPEHVFVLTPTDSVVPTVEQCAESGVKVVTVLASGFSESGPEGEQREAALRGLCRRSGIRVLGPSSLGVVNPRNGFVLTANAAFAEPELPSGRVFVASHSGSMIGSLVSRGKARGVGFAGLVSVGGEADLSVGEICSATLDDPSIEGYLLFLESLRHGAELRKFAIEAARRGKPVIAYKLGRSEAAAEMAATHTGAHAVEFDDIFRDAAYHPGCPTIAAALAVAEDRGSSGAQLLKAITAGYEISTRIGVAVQPSHYRFFHTTGTVGCFGGAAAAAALHDDPRGDVMRHALATAATFASGLQQAFRSDAMTKALHAGHAAWVGVTSATGAANGLTGALDILEGEAGFGAALSVDPKWDRATEALGERYNITAVTQKNHGCCGHTFAAIDAMLAARAEHGFDASQIMEVTIDTYQAAVDVTGNFEPRTAFEAKFSLPYVVSHALLYGAVRLDAFLPERLKDPRIHALMAKIKLNSDPEFSAGFPRMRAARLIIDLTDGRVIRQFAPYRKGDPEAPLSDKELEEKFVELSAPVIGGERANALLDRLWNIEDVGVVDLGLERLGPAVR